MFTKVFLNYLLNVVEKDIFPYMSKQESAMNAGESFFQVCFMQYLRGESGIWKESGESFFQVCFMRGFVVPEILVLYL